MVVTEKHVDLRESEKASINAPHETRKTIEIMHYVPLDSATVR